MDKVRQKQQKQNPRIILADLEDCNLQQQQKRIGLTEVKPTTTNYTQK